MGINIFAGVLIVIVVVATASACLLYTSKCDHAINKRIEYNLIRELGRLDAPGRPILFGTTEEFLRNFGVQSLEELPAINPVQVEDFKAEAEEEVELRLNV